MAEDFTCDPASQVTNILHQLTATSTQIDKADYAYNGVGNRTSLTDRRGAQTFGYDALDRLTTASHPLLLDPQAFAYDAVGNRTTGESVVNAGNQLTADSNVAYQYDDNGNLIKKTLLATGNCTQYSYDAENRLVQVQEFSAGNPTAITTATYRYDGLGRRIEKVANGQTIRYVYDGEDILLEYDGANVLQARYTHGPGIDEPIAVTKGGSTFFYHQDGLGSVTELTDSTGSVAKAYAYDAYGNILKSPGTMNQPHTYTGLECDSETGRYYYRARYYDAATGRFLQKDPKGLGGGDINFHNYVRNDPARLTDPFGLQNFPPPPPGVPGRPWTWRPDSNNSRGGAYTHPSIRSASWDSDGSHWDVDDGKGARQHDDRWGNELSPDKAHAYKGPKQRPITPRLSCRILGPLGAILDFLDLLLEYDESVGSVCGNDPSCM